MEQKDKTGTEKELLELQDSLDQYTFGYETIDVQKIKQIISRIDEILEEDPQEFQKEVVWNRICAASEEEAVLYGSTKATPVVKTVPADQKFEKRGNMDSGELSAEFGVESLEIPREGRSDTVKSIGVENKSVEGLDNGGKLGRKRGVRFAGRKRRFLRGGIAAAVLAATLFVGINIGTYATEKKDLFEIVEEMSNGTTFRVNGDAEKMETDVGGQVYFSWNEVPNEYRSLTLIPYGLPDELELYRIEISKVNTFNLCQIRYIDGSGKMKIDLEIIDYEGREFAFQNSLVEKEEYKPLKEIGINDITVKYYEDLEEGYIARFAGGGQWITFYSNLSLEMLEDIVRSTIDNNFW